MIFEHAVNTLAKVIDVLFIQVIHRAVIVEKERHLAYFKSVQRFVGITAQVTCQGQVRIQFETCYRGMYIISMTVAVCITQGLAFSGEYFEPYYLEIEVKDKKLKVSRRLLDYSLVSYSGCSWL